MTEQEVIAQAVIAFMDAGHSEGDRIAHATVRGYLQCQDPMEPNILVEEGQRRTLIYMQRFGSFREALLVNHKIALASDYGAGYRWVPAVEQTEYGHKQAVKAAQKALRRGSNIVEHVDVSKLSNSQAADRANTAAHLSNLKGVVGQDKPKIW